MWSFVRKHADVWVAAMAVMFFVWVFYTASENARIRKQHEKQYIAEHNCQKIGSVGMDGTRQSIYRCDQGIVSQSDIRQLMYL